MASTRLSDIHKYLTNKEDHISGPHDCHVVNIDSPYPRPRAYTYRGCLYPEYKGHICGKSIEAGSNDCKDDHFDPLLAGNHMWLFRFHVLLVDANHGGLPLKATLFESAKNLVELGPEDFQRMGEERLDLLMKQISMAAPLVTVWIRTYADGRCIVQKLDKVIALDSPPSSPLEIFYSPSTTGFTTPKSSKQAETRGSSSTSRLSCSARGNVSIDNNEDLSLQRSLAEVMDFLGSLKTRDDE